MPGVMQEPKRVSIDRRTGTTVGWQKKSSAHWLDVCRSWSFADRSLIKAAEIGGELSTPFEQAFSNLAHSYIAEKAPKLLDYEAGFQLLDRSDDNTRAVGIFGFKVSNQWLYAPVFFLNGSLEGHELLYIKNQDLFVPMKDNWVNYLLGRKPNILGKPVERNLSRLGVLSPNLYQLSRSPYKAASADVEKLAAGRSNLPPLASWAVDFLPVLAKWSLTKVAFDSDEKFLEAIQSMGPAGLDFLVKMAEQYPTLFQTAETFYGSDRLQKLARDIGTDARLAQSSSLLARLTPKPVDGTLPQRLTKQAEKEKTKDVEVIVRRDLADGNAPAMLLSDDEHTEWAEEGRLVRDRRPDSAISAVYNVSTSLKLYSPSGTNIYEILVRPDRFEKCLVIAAPYAESGREEFCTVISLDSDDRWLNIHPSRVFCRTEYSKEAWNEWFDKQDDATSLPLSESPYRTGTLVVLFSKDGQGTCPFRASEKYEDDSGSVYDVRFDDYCDYDNRKSGVHTNLHKGTTINHSDIADEVNVKSIRLTGRYGTKFRSGRDELYVPAGFKKRIVAKAANEDEDGPHCEIGPNGGSAKKPLQPGNLSDVMYALQAALPPLKLVHDGHDIEINDRKLSKAAAFKALVVDWGLRAATADLLIKTAAGKPRQKCEYLVKKGTDAGWMAGQSSPAASGAGSAPTAGLGAALGAEAPMTGMGAGAAAAGGEASSLTASPATPSAGAGASAMPAAQPEAGGMTASAASGGAKTDVRTLFKTAGPYLTEGGGPNAQGIPEQPYAPDYIMNSGKQMQMPFEQHRVEPGMRTDPANRELYRAVGPDPDTLQTASQAGQTGQKEVFDTAMLGSLLKTVRQDSMIDRYLGDLMKGMDRLGRIYYQYLWHGQEFEDRFGASELPEIKDGIRNTFEGLGDIILKMKQKGVEPFAEEGTDVDLGGVANQ